MTDILPWTCESCAIWRPATFNTFEEAEDHAMSVHASRFLSVLRRGLPESFRVPLVALTLKKREDV